jgi:cell wall-associated NlpC family hydrolase
MTFFRLGAPPLAAPLLVCLATLLLGAPVALGRPHASPPSSPSPAGQTDPGQADPGQPPGQNGPSVPDLPGAPPRAPTPPSTPTPPPKHPSRPITGAIPADPVLSGPTVPGSVAELLPSGRAAAPADSPRAIRVMIWTANRLIGLGYRWGGGHGSFSDRGYDCSGTVSYALHAAALIAAPDDSRGLEHWGGQGAGHWVTVYARNGHAFMVIAGLRLDTSPEGDPSGLDGPRWRPSLRDTRGYRARHPLAGV